MAQVISKKDKETNSAYQMIEPRIVVLWALIIEPTISPLTRKLNSTNGSTGSGLDFDRSNGGISLANTFH